MAKIYYSQAVLDHKQFGASLKRARTREGFSTVDALAEHLGKEGVHISSRSLRRYEHGSHVPSSEMLAALIKALPSDRGLFYIDNIVRDFSNPYHRIALTNLRESLPLMTTASVFPG